MQRNFGLYSRWIWIQHLKHNHKTPGTVFLFSNCLIISSEMTVSICISFSVLNEEEERTLCVWVCIYRVLALAQQGSTQVTHLLIPRYIWLGSMGDQQHSHIVPLAPKVALMPTLLPSGVLIAQGPSHSCESENLQRSVFLKYLRMLTSLKYILETYYSRCPAMSRLLLIHSVLMLAEQIRFYRW